MSQSRYGLHSHVFHDFSAVVVHLKISGQHFPVSMGLSVCLRTRDAWSPGGALRALVPYMMSVHPFDGIPQNAFNESSLDMFALSIGQVMSWSFNDIEVSAYYGMAFPPSNTLIHGSANSKSFEKLELWTSSCFNWLPNVRVDPGLFFWELHENTIS